MMTLPLNSGSPRQARTTFGAMRRYTKGPSSMRGSQPNLPAECVRGVRRHVLVREALRRPLQHHDIEGVR